MLVESLLDLIYNLLDTLFTPINLPSLPASLSTIIDTLCSYISDGLALVANWTHLQYLLALFGIVAAVDVGILLYKLIMWILKKIPMLGIE